MSQPLAEACGMDRKTGKTVRLILRRPRLSLDDRLSNTRENNDKSSSMVIWNWSDGRSCRAGRYRFSRCKRGRKQTAAQAAGYFRVRAHQHAARARIACGTRAISRHRFPYSYFFLRQVGKRRRAGARTKVLGYA